MKYRLGLMLVCASVVGCGGRPLPGDDMSIRYVDMAAPIPDLAVSIDLGPGDMAIPNDALKPVLYSQFASDYATTTCTHLAQCGKVDSDAMSQAACREVNAFHFGKDWDSEIMSGRVIVNELQCINAIMNSRCDGTDAFYVQSQCVTFLFKGMQQNGQSCISSEECANGYCLHPLIDGGTDYQTPGCQGMCSALKATGASCDAFDSCASPLDFCIGAIGNRKCTALRTPPGMPCTGKICQRGYYCPTFGTNPTCTAPQMQLLKGGACDPQQIFTPVPPCGPGLYCQHDLSDAGTLVGATCQPHVAMGGMCDTHMFDAVNDNACVDGFHCATPPGSTLGVCAAYGKTGTACNPPVNSREASPVECKVNLYCDANTKTCQPLAPDGTACTTPPGAITCLAYTPNTYSQPPRTCFPNNPDAGTYSTCNQYQNVGTSCLPGSQDAICFPSGGFLGVSANAPSTSYCAPAKNGGGACAPKCR